MRDHIYYIYIYISLIRSWCISNGICHEFISINTEQNRIEKLEWIVRTGSCDIMLNLAQISSTVWTAPFLFPIFCRRLGYGREGTGISPPFENTFSRIPSRRRIRAARARLVAAICTAEANIVSFVLVKILFRIRRAIPLAAARYRGCWLIPTATNAQLYAAGGWKS